MSENEQCQTGRPVIFSFRTILWGSNHHAGAICVFNMKRFLRLRFLCGPWSQKLIFESDLPGKVPRNSRMGKWCLQESSLNSKATMIISKNIHLTFSSLGYIRTKLRSTLRKQAGNNPLHHEYHLSTHLEISLEVVTHTPWWPWRMIAVWKAKMIPTGSTGRIKPRHDPLRKLKESIVVGVPNLEMDGYVQPQRQQQL